MKLALLSLAIIGTVLVIDCQAVCHHTQPRANHAKIPNDANPYHLFEHEGQHYLCGAHNEPHFHIYRKNSFIGHFKLGTVKYQIHGTDMNGERRSACCGFKAAVERMLRELDTPQITGKNKKKNLKQEQERQAKRPCFGCMAKLAEKDYCKTHWEDC